MQKRGEPYFRPQPAALSGALKTRDHGLFSELPLEPKLVISVSGISAALDPDLNPKRLNTRGLLKGSCDLVSKVSIRITPPRGLITPIKTYYLLSPTIL